MIKINLGDDYRNFRAITRAADYPHRSIFEIKRKKFWRLPELADNPLLKTKENRRLTKFLHCFCWHDTFSLQLINFQTSCFRCSIENDATCKKSVLKKKTISRVLMSRRNRLTRENTLKLKAVLAEKLSQMRRIFYSVN